MCGSLGVQHRYVQQSFSGCSDHSLHPLFRSYADCLWEFNAESPPDEENPPADEEERSKTNAIIRELFHSYAEHEFYIPEIQLRRIVDKMANKSASQGTDGDEVMQKGGETISKFSKGALEIGAAVNEAILEKVREVFDLNKG